MFLEPVLETVLLILDTSMLSTSAPKPSLRSTLVTIRYDIQ